MLMTMPPVTGSGNICFGNAVANFDAFGASLLMAFSTCVRLQHEGDFSGR
jgi:hypothetical protein